MEENLAQLYDDLFVETCADWAVPYIGDLIGYEPLHALGRTRGLARAEVAHTIALRRRKGTVPVLEQLARDVTGWNARAVEYFQLLATTQYMNHLRPFNHYAPDLRRWEPLARVGGAFESIPHTVDVRRIESGRGRFNIPNVGVVPLAARRIPPYAQPRGARSTTGAGSRVRSAIPCSSSPTRSPKTRSRTSPSRSTCRTRSGAAVCGRARGSTTARGRRRSTSVDNVDPSIVLYVDDAEIAARRRGRLRPAR